MTINDFQAMYQRKLMTMPAHARAAYDEANATFRAAVRSVANVSAPLPTPEQTRSATVVVNSVSDRLADAIEQAREAKRTNGTATGDGRKTAFDKDSDSLAQAILRARAAKQGE
jgi:hypothetical protein